MRVFWWLMLWAGVLGAALSLAGRVRHELRPSPVEIALEWSDATRLSGAGRVPIDRWLASMRAAGARGVVLPVQSVRDLAEEGRLTLWTRAAASTFFRRVRTLDSGYNFVVVCRDEKLRVRVRAALADASRVLPLFELDATGFAVALSPATMGTWPVGLDPLALQQLREAKLEPLARLGDFSGATPARSSAQFLALRRDGVRLLVAGDPSPGNETLLPETARSMRANGLSLAWVELDTARGTPELARRSRGWLVRAHTISSLDSLRLEPGAMEDRFARAARERNARLLLVRMPRGQSGEEGASGRSGWQQNRDFVAAVARETRENSWSSFGRPKLSIGLARRFGTGSESARRAALARFVAGLSVVAGSMLMLGLFVPLSPRSERIGGALGLLCVALFAFFPVEGAMVLALGTSLIFPILALAWSGANGRGANGRGMKRRDGWKNATGRRAKGNQVSKIEVNPGEVNQSGVNPMQVIQDGANRDGSETRDTNSHTVSQHSTQTRSVNQTWREATMDSLWVLVRATAFSLAGGLVVAALLRDWTFAAKVADFWGTKAASIIPVGLVALLLLGEFWPGSDSRRGWVRARRRTRVLSRRAFPLRDVLLGAASLGVVALWLARSGNDSGVGVSDLEWRFRALLESLFVARPRTKEFLLCHPALLIGALLLFSRRGKVGAWAFLLLGTIGQISIVNSFAQANNPLYVPLWRTLLSLGLGGAFGWILARTLAPRLGFARDLRPWRGGPMMLRLAGATTLALLLLWSGRTLILRRRYAELTAPSGGTSWPWRSARREVLRRGVEHHSLTLDDGTTLDLLAFDFGANPRLRLSLWDSDLDSSPDKIHPRDRFAYWNCGVGKQSAKINARGDVVALWNAGFWGLLNRHPRADDRAFHLSPVVVNGRAHYCGPNRRWTWGAQTRAGQTDFRLEHQPTRAALERDFDCATGTLQALIRDGEPLALRPYPWFAQEIEHPPIPSTPREAGHIPTLDWMHTSRASAGWTGQKLWVLLVKEPDGEAPSRALVARWKRGRGGWTLADEQRFWRSFGARNAVGFDGGDVLQSVWRRSDGTFSVLVPRLALPESQSATLQLSSDARFSSPPVRVLRGGALSYFVVREQ